MGLGLSDFLRLKASATDVAGPGPKRALPGFGKAKNVILIFLQGGPSHIDLWDPKPDAPDNIRGLFKPIETKTRACCSASTCRSSRG